MPAAKSKCAPRLRRTSALLAAAAPSIETYSPSSPAYIEGQAKRSDRERRIRVGGLRMQANQYENDARFYRGAAKVALVGGVLGGLGASAKAFAPTGTA